LRIILGIDPGSRITGYGIIGAEGSKYHYIASGAIKTKGDEISARLYQIYSQLKDVLTSNNPHEAAIEEIFYHNNFKSALKLGQARGSALVAVASRGLPVAEYSARAIKQAVVGYGAATKEQIQHMVKKLLNVKGELQADEADALAIAICHGQNRILNKVYKELIEETK